MDTEGSVKSEQSSRSRRRGTRHSHRSNHHSRKHPDMAPFQTSVNLGDSRDGQEIIEVQILPQDENWGENTTAITGNTSEQSISMEDVSNWQNNNDSGIGFACQRYIETTFSLVLSSAAFLSPIAMVMLPKMGFFPTAFESSDLTQLNRAHLLACNGECKGLLVSLVARMLLLALGLWALFLRRPTAKLPRVFMFRAMVQLLVLVATFAYWLFYIVQVTEGTKALVEGHEASDYKSLVSYATNFVDTLLFIHYIACVLLEIRHQQPAYYVKGKKAFNFTLVKHLTDWRRLFFSGSKPRRRESFVQYWSIEYSTSCRVDTPKLLHRLFDLQSVLGKSSDFQIAEEGRFQFQILRSWRCEPIPATKSKSCCSCCSRKASWFIAQRTILRGTRIWSPCEKASCSAHNSRWRSVHAYPSCPQWTDASYTIGSTRSSASSFPEYGSGFAKVSTCDASAAQTHRWSDHPSPVPLPKTRYVAQSLPRTVSSWIAAVAKRKRTSLGAAVVIDLRRTAVASIATQLHISADPKWRFVAGECVQTSVL